MNKNITTEYARKCLANKLDSCRIARKLAQFDNEVRFAVCACRYIEALKRSHNASDCALAARLGHFLEHRDYEAAIQAWEGRR